MNDVLQGDRIRAQIQHFGLIHGNTTGKRIIGLIENSETRAIVCVCVCVCVCVFAFALSVFWILRNLLKLSTQKVMHEAQKMNFLFTCSSPFSACRQSVTPTFVILEGSVKYSIITPTTAHIL